jgi:glycine dehydrogenase subunit 1
VEKDLPKVHVHPYIPNAMAETKAQMMKDIAIKDIEELYDDVPKRFRLTKRLNLPEAMSEQEVKEHVMTLLAKNKSCRDVPTFLGAGCWSHYVPAAVDHIIERSEFLTSYTPYQPEISQGMLQALFEYQSMICELIGLDVANASMYDWASALGEAVRMGTRVNRRLEVIVPRLIHPDRYATLQTYVDPLKLRIRKADYNRETGLLSLEDLKNQVSDKTSAVYVENPSYLGPIESQVEEISEITHDCGALFIVGVDPISLGTLRAPADYGADIVVGEGQPLGNHLNYGGPLLGLFACRDEIELIRQMPGRVIGMTTTITGDKTAYCMALQTREQHIRRERATSNICTNEALCGVASATYLALLGPQGLRELDEVIMSKTRCAMQQIAKIHGVKVPLFKAKHFKEFTVNFNGTGKKVRTLNQLMLKQCNIQAGKNVSKEFPELGETALYCVTELHSKQAIDHLADALRRVLRKKR